MTKKERLIKIERIITENEVSTQEELTDLLNNEGLSVSQASVSRYIKELNLIKTEGIQKKFRYVKAGKLNGEIPQKIVDLFKQITVSVVSAGNLVVIKTLAGNGSSAGMAVDAMHFPQVLGCVAGDDTLLVVTKTESDADVLIKSLRMI